MFLWDDIGEWSGLQLSKPKERTQSPRSVLLMQHRRTFRAETLSAVFAKATTSEETKPDDWPMFRGNVAGGNATKSRLGTQWVKAWETSVGQRGKPFGLMTSQRTGLTQAVSAYGLVVVSDIDGQRVVALDAAGRGRSSGFITWVDGWSFRRHFIGGCACSRHVTAGYIVSMPETGIAGLQTAGCTPGIVHWGWGKA